MADNNLLNEILEEPAVLRRVHDAYVRNSSPAMAKAADLLRRCTPVYLAGMATSDYGSYPAACLLNRAGKMTVPYDVSELLYYHLETITPGSCLVVVSQSGNSAEIIHILQALNGRVPVVGVYNYEDSYLAQHCDIGLPIFAGPQLACGSKTNVATVGVMLLLAEAVQGHDLNPAGQRLLALADSLGRFYKDWETVLSPAVDFLAGSEYTVFLGRGPGKSSAQFSATLFREVPKVVAEGMAAADFRHGLREMIRPEHRVVIFAPAGGTHDLCIGIARDTLKLGIPVMVVTNRDIDLEASKNLHVVKTDLHDEYWAPILDMVPLQLLGYQLAKRYGLEPGKLVISTNVTTVE